jgi:hypothetical protein
LGFLRHGCFTPETGHWLARLARISDITSHHSITSSAMASSDGGHFEAEHLDGLEIDHEPHWVRAT